MPEVFAKGSFVGLVEWTCIRAVNPHLDWPEEQTVGTHVDLSHVAATSPGLEVTVRVELVTGVRPSAQRPCYLGGVFPRRRAFALVRPAPRR
jgi:predicted thioesterase